MFLSVTCTKSPATDLGYLLYKNPARFQSFDTTMGKAHVFFPEATPEKCTVALVVDMDPLDIAKKKRLHGSGFALEPYVNDRPYAASSFLSVAIGQVFGTAMSGRSEDRPELAAAALDLQATVAALPASDDDLLRRLFEPLGYKVTLERGPLDVRFPDWGEAPTCVMHLRGNVRLRDLLTHLYVLIPVLDDAKHYWVEEAEVEKLLRHGAEWLPSHPARELIVNRYLRHQRRLEAKAWDAMSGAEDALTVPEATPSDQEDGPALSQQRMEAVVEALHEVGARRVLDLGCGEGRLLELLAKDKAFTEIAGLEVSWKALQRAQDRLRDDRLAPAQRGRIKLLHGSLVYRDDSLKGYDAAALVEVVEHIDPDRLGTLEAVVFGSAKPGTVIVTTPNVEANDALGVPKGEIRHEDHRFEWTRAEFAAWANRVAAEHGYHVEIRGVGPEFDSVGHPTQMGVFRRSS